MDRGFDPTLRDETITESIDYDTCRRDSMPGPADDHLIAFPDDVFRDESQPWIERAEPSVELWIPPGSGAFRREVHGRHRQHERFCRSRARACLILIATAIREAV